VQHFGTAGKIVTRDTR